MASALTQWKQVAPANPWALVWAGVDDRNGKHTIVPRTGPSDRHAWWDLQDAAQVASTDGTAGRRYALHEARHTTATLLLEGDVDTEVIKAIMGHSSIVASRGYMHVSQALARKALDDVAAKLGLTAGPSRAARG
jgi:integrase